MNNLMFSQSFDPPIFLCKVRFRKSSRGYFRASIPVQVISAVSKLIENRKVKAVLYIDDLGVVTKTWKLKGKYVDLQIPVLYADKVDPSKEYKVYLKSIEDLTKSLERKVIIYGKGKKARIEIPRWYLDIEGVPHKKVVLKTTIKCKGKFLTLFTTYNGRGPAVQVLPPMDTYPAKVTVYDAKVYNIDDFVRDFNSLKLEKYSNIKLSYKTKLKLEIDNEAVDIRNWKFSTYAYYSYILLEIESEKPGVIRIHNYGNNIKIYDIQHGGYLPVESIHLISGCIIISYYDPRRGKIRRHFIPLVSSGGYSHNSYVKQDPIQKIDEIQHLSDNIIVVDITIKPEEWKAFIDKAIDLQRRWYCNKEGGYEHHVAKFGEKIAAYCLSKLGYKIEYRHDFPWKKGTDIICSDKNNNKFAVEVKTAYSTEIPDCRMREAIKRARYFAKIYGCDNYIVCLIEISGINNKCKLTLIKSNNLI